MELSSQAVLEDEDCTIPESTVKMSSAVEAENWELVKKLLSRVDVSARDVKNSSLLQKLASARGISPLVVRNLINEACSKQEESQPLKNIAKDLVKDAAKCDNWDIVIVFLSVITDLLEDEASVLFLVQLMVRSQKLREKPYFHIDVLSALWRHAKNKIVDSTDKTVQNSFTQLFAELNMWSRVCDLLVSKPDLNLLDRDGLSVLHRLVMCPDSRFDSLLPVLLENGADVSLKNSEGHTALHLAATHQKVLRVGNDEIERKDIKSKIMNEYHIKRVESKLQALRQLLTSAKTLDDCDSKGNTATILAAKNNNWEFFKLLLEHGARADVVGECQRSVLHFLALTGSLMEPVTCEKLINLCIIRGAQVNSRDVNECSALHVALKSQNWIVFRLVVNLGADAGLRDSEGYNVLHRLAMMSSEHAEHVRSLFDLLVHRGADLNAQCPAGNTILHVAARFQNLWLVKYLLHLGTCTHHFNREGFTILHLLTLYQQSSSNNPSCEIEQTDVLSTLDLLLQKGADLELRCSSGDTALHLAARHQNWTVVKHLLQRGARIHEVDSEGVTIMERFVQSNMELSEEDSIFRLLIQHAAAANKLSSRKGYCESVLQLAAKHEKWCVVEHILRHEGGDPDERDCEGFTLFQRVAMTLGKTFPGWFSSYVTCFLFSSETVKKYELSSFVQMVTRRQTVEVLRVLLGILNDVNMTDWNGFTLLHRVTERCVPNTAAIIRSLIDKGADLDKTCPDGNNAVQLAAKNNNWLAVHHLLQYGASVTAVDNEGLSVLHRLLQQPNIRCKQCRQSPAAKTPLILLSLLLSKGAWINQKDRHGNTPLHLAVKYEHWDMAIELLARGASLTERDSKGCSMLHILATRANSLRSEEPSCLENSLLDIQNEKGDVDRRLFVEETCVACSVDADPDFQLKFFCSSLMKENFNHLDMCDLFVSHTKLIDAPDPQGNTALMLSAIHNNWDVTQQLVIKGANPCLLNSQGLTLLHILASAQSMCKHFVLFEDLQRDIIRHIISFGCDINTRDSEGNTPIQLAAKHGNMDMVERLLELQDNANETDSEGFTLSRVAQTSSPRCKDIVRRLVEKGAHLNLKIPDDRVLLLVTPKTWHTTLLIRNANTIGDLFQAEHLIIDRFIEIICITETQENEMELLTELITMKRSGVVINRISDGRSLIQLAFMTKQWDIVEMLLENGEYTDPEPLLGESVFHYFADWALNVEEEECFLSLMPRPYLNINLRNSGGETPLNILAQNSRWQWAQLFVERGADVNMVDSNGWTMLHQLAMIRNYWHEDRVRPSALLKLCCDKGADINMTVSNGKTAVKIAMENKSWSIFWRLIHMGAQQDWNNDEKLLIVQNVNYISKICTSDENLKVFIKHLLLSTKKDSKPALLVQRSFQACIENYKWSVAKLLLECTLEADVKSLLENRFLLCLIIENYRKKHHEAWISLLDTLIERGLDINSRGYEDESVLMEEAVLWSLADNTPDSLFRVLLQRGADPLLTDSNGNSLLVSVMYDLGPYTLKAVISLLELGLVSRENHDEDGTEDSDVEDSASPTRLAVERKNILVLKILIECDVSCNSELFALNTEYQLKKSLETERNGPSQRLEQICLILEQATTQPRSLESLCRVAVCRSIPWGLSRRDMVLSLPIPFMLQNYLLFADVISDPDVQAGLDEHAKWIFYNDDYDDDEEDDDDEMNF